MVEIRVTRPELYSMIEPDLSRRDGRYFTGATQREAIEKATTTFGSEVIDVEINRGSYLGAFKRVYVGTEDECFIQMPHTLPDQLELILKSIHETLQAMERMLSVVCQTKKS